MKRTWRRRSCLVWTLALAAVLPGIAMESAAAAPACAPAAADAVSAQQLARACGGRVEAMSDRSPYRQLFANADGSYTTEDSVVPTRVRRPDGSWTTTDPALVRTADGWSPRASVLDVTVSNGGSGPFATYRYAGQTITMSWPFGALPAPVVSGTAAKFAGVLPGVDLWVTTSVTGFRPVLAIANATAAANPVLRAVAYQIGGSVRTESTSDGRVRFAALATGATVAMADAPVMWDSTPGGPISTAEHPGDLARIGQVALSTGGSDLTIRPDAAMLTSATWPLYVDPTINPSQSRWAYADSANANNTTDYARVGLDPGTGDVYRSYFNFPTAVGSLTWRGKKILAAEFDIELYHSYACNDTQDDWTWAYNTGAIKSSPRMPWSGSGAVALPGLAGEAARGHANKAGGCGALQPDFLMTFSGPAMTSLVQTGADRNWSQYTVGLCACNPQGSLETSAERWKKFYIDSRAKFIVTFDTVPGTPTTLTTSGAACGSRIGTLTPTLSARAVDADSGDTLSATFHWQQVPSGSVITVNRTGIPANNNTTATLNLPSTADGGTFQWQIQTKDAAGYSSAWSSWCTFTVDIAAPPLPAVAPTGSPSYPSCDPGTISGCVAAGGPGIAGSFAVGPNGATNVTSFRYGWTSPPTLSVTVAAGASATIKVTPPQFGLNTLYVQSNNGVKSGPVRPYRFLVAGPSAPLAGWPLDSFAGHGLNDQVSGVPLSVGPGFSWTSGARYIGANAATFNGDSGTGYGTATVAALDTSKSFSVGAWVRLSSLATGNRAAVGADDTGGASPFTLGMFQTGTPTAPHWTFRLNGIATASAPAPVTAADVNRWVYLLGTYDAAAKTASVYVNGTLAQTVSATTAPVKATGPVTIGRAWWNGGATDGWPGGIADIRLWNRVATTDDLWGTDADAANGVPAVDGLMAPNQVGSWDFADTPDCGCRGPSIDGAYFGRGVYLDAGWANATPTSAYTMDSHNGNGALWTDGSAGYASTTDPATGTAQPVLRTEQSFSVSAWVSLDSLPTHNVTAVSQPGAVNSAFLLSYQWANGTTPQWTFLVVGVDTMDPANYPAYIAGATTDWTHLVGVYDAVAGTAKLYVNGVLAATRTGVSSFAANGSLTLGSALWNAHATDRWPGQVDQVQLWQGVLSDRQIAGLYKNS